MAHSGERESVAQTVRRKRLVTKGRNMFTVNVSPSIPTTFKRKVVDITTFVCQGVASSG